MVHPTANRRRPKAMVNIPLNNSHMAVINNLLRGSILPSKADISNRRVTTLLMADLLHLNNLTVATSNNLLHNTTAHLLDLRKVIMELLLLSSSRTATTPLRRQVLHRDSTARLLLSSMAHHQFSLLLPRWATDHLRSFNGTANLTLTACERP